LRMAQGAPGGEMQPAGMPEPILTIVPAAALGVLVLLLGLYLPPALSQTIQEAARALG
jgi:hypothetical protein